MWYSAADVLRVCAGQCLLVLFHDMIQYSTVLCGKVWDGAVQYGMARFVFRF